MPRRPEELLLRTFGDNQGNVVVLFVRTESADLVDNGGEERLRRKGAVPAQGFDEAGFAKFLAGIVERFGDAVGI